MERKKNTSIKINSVNHKKILMMENYKKFLLIIRNFCLQFIIYVIKISYQEFQMKTLN